MVDISQFDPQSFLDASTTEAATRRPPLPVDNPASPDTLYTGVIQEPKMRTWQGKKDPSQSGLAIDIPILIDVPGQLQDQLKLPAQIQLTAGGFVDLTAQGLMDWSPGKNSTLRRYREATGLNVAGQTFSPRMLQGKVVKVKITHELYNGDIMDKIGNVLKA